MSMPYADPAEQAEFHRNLFYLRYQNDPEFREAESLRKAKWYQRNKEKLRAKRHEKLSAIRGSG